MIPTTAYGPSTLVDPNCIGPDILYLYGGEVRVKFSSSDHRYLVSDIAVEDGTWLQVPSVTTVLGSLDKSKFLVPWATKLAMNEFLKRVEENKSYTRAELDAIGHQIRTAHKLALDTASRVGSMTHNWIQSYLEFKAGLHSFVLPPEDEQVRNCCRGARQFILDSNLKPVLVERILYHRAARVIGTCDIAGTLATINGTLSIADWKSSNSVEGHNYEWQLASYSKIYEAVTGVAVPGRVIIHLDKESGKATPKILPPEDLEKDWQAFLGLLKAHNRLVEQNVA